MSPNTGSHYGLNRAALATFTVSAWMCWHSPAPICTAETIPCLDEALALADVLADHPRQHDGVDQLSLQGRRAQRSGERPGGLRGGLIPQIIVMN
jgi:hypothetical protein